MQVCGISGIGGCVNSKIEKRYVVQGYSFFAILDEYYIKETVQKRQFLGSPIF